MKQLGILFTSLYILCHNKVKKIPEHLFSHFNKSRWLRNKAVCPLSIRIYENCG
ncbi:conserved hypothetical protein [delta proteobacterium NaphS2]|nr:conserved hypothetical protein [delta proteobacterium NaphS2]